MPGLPLPLLIAGGWVWPIAIPNRDTSNHSILGALLTMVNRKQLLDALGPEPRSISDLAAQFGASRKDVQDALPHIVRSARAAGRQLVIVPARCRDCDFTFDESKLSKPGRCPKCRGTWIYEPLIGTKS